ncbi:MAG: GNAT family N-acetyltransferase [Woeseiaceae bacterium]
MDLRPATHEDLPTLLKFEQGVVEEERPFNAAIKAASVVYYDLPDLISNPRSLLLIAEHNGDAAGCGYVQLRESKAAFSHELHGYLGFMYVLRDFRGQRLNKQIVDALLKWGRAQGVQDFYLDVYAENQAAIRAYEKAGFKPLMVEMKL